MATLSRVTDSSQPTASMKGRALLGLSLLAAVGTLLPSLAPYRDVLRAAVGVFAFTSGAFGTVDVRLSAIASSVVAGLGLALVGVGPNHAFPGVVGFELGIACAMGGVLGLGGSIHRLGRLGPDVAADRS